VAGPIQEETVPKIQTEHTRLRYDLTKDQFELWLVWGNHTQLMSSISAEAVIEPNTAHTWASENCRQAAQLLYSYIRAEIDRQLGSLIDVREKWKMGGTKMMEGSDVDQ